MALQRGQAAVLLAGVAVVAAATISTARAAARKSHTVAATQAPAALVQVAGAPKSPTKIFPFSLPLPR